MLPSRIIKVKRFWSIRFPSASHQCKRNTSNAEDTLAIDTSEKLTEYSEEELNSIRNKSKLRPDHYRIYAGEHPRIPDDEKPQYMRTLKWQRKLIGLCGFDGQYNPGICFATKEEMEDLTEYEKVAFNESLFEIRERELKKSALLEQQRYEREKEITKNLAKQEEWVKQIRARMNERDEIAEQAKAERARLLEEVRRYFGYPIDPKNEKFQIMLAVKERELVKEKKIAKKQQQERQFMEKLAALEAGSDSSSSKKPDSTKNTKS